MTDQQQDLEMRVRHLEGEVQWLRHHLEELASKAFSTTPPPKKPVTAIPVEEGVPTSEDLLNWAGRASLLPRVAAVCFIMVFALALRTATDSQMLQPRLGTLLGVLFALSLMLSGWLLYRRTNPLAPVITISGAFLVFSVVVETAAHFKSLPPVPAYLVLIFTGGWLWYLSQRFQVALPVIAGTLVMCLAGVAIEYPTPIFSYLSPLLLFANALGFFATRIRRCSWLRWFVLGVTVFVMQVWGIKLGIHLVKGEPPPRQMALYWFYPHLVVFALAFVVSSFFGIVRSGEERISKFDFAVPTLNAFWTFGAAYYVISKGGGEAYIGLGIVALAAVVAHYVIALGLARRMKVRAPGTNTFILAGSVWLALGLPLVTGSQVLAAPILSGTALGLFVFSRQWLSGGVRLTSYLLQAYACLVLVLALKDQPQGPHLIATLIASGIAALAALYHYRWSQKNAPPEVSRLFGHYDQTDKCSVILLIAGLVAGFYQARALAHWILQKFTVYRDASFICTQSILINLAIAVLMSLALQRKSRVLRNIAILVTIIGGGKVFLVDLLGTKGLPLVLSVLSFGIVAVIESIILTRWQKFEGTSGPMETGASG